jgi:hypothetical protein
MTPIPYGDIEGKGASDEYERRAADALIDQNSRDDDEGHTIPLGEGDTEEDKEIRKRFPNWSTMNQVQKVAAMETEHIGCVPENDDKEWYIMREKGRWIAHGNVRTYRLCGYYVDFELPFHARFAVPETGSISLEAIKNRILIMGVRDLFWSPNHELLVVLVNTELQVYSPHGQDLGRPVISMKLKESESPVMAEWATGSNVARWTAELKKIKAQGVMKPLLSSSPHP